MLSGLKGLVVGLFCLGWNLLPHTRQGWLAVVVSLPFILARPDSDSRTRTLRVSTAVRCADDADDDRVGAADVPGERLRGAMDSGRRGSDTGHVLLRHPCEAEDLGVPGRGSGECGDDAAVAQEPGLVGAESGHDLGEYPSGCLSREANDDGRRMDFTASRRVRAVRRIRPLREALGKCSGVEGAET